MGISGKGVFKNEKIAPALRAEMEKMNLQVYGYMREDNYEMLSQLFSDSLLARIRPEFSSKFLPQIQKVIRGRAYHKFDDIYVKQDKTKDTITVSGGKAEESYKLKFIVRQNETFISMFIAGDTLNEVMITVLYIKENGKWKIGNLTGEDFSLNRQSAVALFEQARKLEAEGDLIDAINFMGLSADCIKPGGNIFTYDQEAEIRKFNDSLTKKTNSKYNFPLTVSQLPGKPVIFNIHIEVVARHLSPLIMYISNTSVADTVALKSENNEMQKKIGEIFPGIEKHNNTLLYRAYNVMPDGKNDPRYYGYIQHLN